jgi:hypothetical protein
VIRFRFKAIKSLNQLQCPGKGTYQVNLFLGLKQVWCIVLNSSKEEEKRAAEQYPFMSIFQINNIIKSAKNSRNKLQT